MGILSTVVGAFILYAVLGRGAVCSEILCLVPTILICLFSWRLQLLIPMRECCCTSLYPSRWEMDGIPVRILCGIFFYYHQLGRESGDSGILFNFIVFFLMTRNQKHTSPKDFMRRQSSAMRQEPQNGQGRKKSTSTSVQYAGVPNWTEMIWNSVSALSVMEIMNTARIICLPISTFINPTEKNLANFIGCSFL